MHGDDVPVVPVAAVQRLTKKLGNRRYLPSTRLPRAVMEEALAAARRGVYVRWNGKGSE